MRSAMKTLKIVILSFLLVLFYSSTISFAEDKPSADKVSKEKNNRTLRLQENTQKKAAVRQGTEKMQSGLRNNTATQLNVNKGVVEAINGSSLITLPTSDLVNYFNQVKQVATSSVVYDPTELDWEAYKAAKVEFYSKKKAYEDALMSQCTSLTIEEWREVGCSGSSYSCTRKVEKWCQIHKVKPQVDQAKNAALKLRKRAFKLGRDVCLKGQESEWFHQDLRNSEEVAARNAEYRANRNRLPEICD